VTHYFLLGPRFRLPQPPEDARDPSCHWQNLSLSIVT